MQLYERGIRRRLAPMLQGDRRRLELAYSLMMTLPGTPVIRYGDEIGMGDDLRLPERNCARTPMQWSTEPQGGFTKSANPVLPVIDEGPYAFQHVNVAQQRRDPNSLLNWTERIIRMRKEVPEIGWGTFTVLAPGTPEVLALRYDWRNNAVRGRAQSRCLPARDIPRSRKPGLTGRRDLVNLLSEDHSHADDERQTSHSARTLWLSLVPRRRPGLPPEAQRNLTGWPPSAVAEKLQDDALRGAELNLGAHLILFAIECGRQQQPACTGIGRERQPLGGKAKIEGDHQAGLLAMPSLECKDIPFNAGASVQPGMQRGLLTAQRYQGTIECQHRPGIRRLRRHIARGTVGVQREPGNPCCEACMVGAVPGHRRACRVPSQSKSRFVQFPAVLYQFRRNGHIFQAQLIPVVNRWRATQGKQQHGRQPRPGRTHTGGNALLIVVPQNPVGGAAFRHCGLVLRNNPSDLPRIPRRKYQLKIERQVRALHIAAVVGDQTLNRQVDLAYQNAVRVGIDDSTHFRYDVVDLWPVGGIALQQSVDAGSG